MVLQNCMYLLKVIPYLYSEMCLTSSHVVNQVTDIKIENVAYMQEEDDPLSTTLPQIKAEHEVSCPSVCVSRYTELPVFFLSSSVFPST